MSPKYLSISDLNLYAALADRATAKSAAGGMVSNSKPMRSQREVDEEDISRSPREMCLRFGWVSSRIYTSASKYRRAQSLSRPRPSPPRPCVESADRTRCTHPRAPLPRPPLLPEPAERALRRAVRCPRLPEPRHARPSSDLSAKCHCPHSYVSRRADGHLECCLAAMLSEGSPNLRKLHLDDPRYLETPRPLSLLRVRTPRRDVTGKWYEAS
ncbi:hypothetical protein OH76DRAFT_1237606 [Lentinus brumalis]|uniref:Uncharacterized protein n=1 Tax=Lentinus brumalis TaxID=2498619 RepID=A0A371CSC4_9APHY|nr:hypothetical protein OH76DRAFT_1237606 [Polyporus brumalis]